MKTYTIIGMSRESLDTIDTNIEQCEISDFLEDKRRNHKDWILIKIELEATLKEDKLTFKAFFTEFDKPPLKEIEQMIKTKKEAVQLIEEFIEIELLEEILNAFEIDWGEIVQEIGGFDLAQLNQIQLNSIFYFGNWYQNELRNRNL